MLEKMYTRPKALAAMVLLLCLVAMGGSGMLVVSNDIRDNLDAQSSELQAFIQYEHTFGSTTSAVVLIQFDDGVFQQQAFTNLQQYTRWAEELPFAYRVNSLTNALVIESIDDNIDVNESFTLLQSSLFSLQDIERLLRKDPQVMGNLVSEDGKVAAIQVLFEIDRSELTIKDEVNAGLYALRDRIRENENTENVYLTGSLIVDDAQKQAVERNYGFLIPLVYVAMFVLLGVMFRSAALVFTVIGCTVLTIMTMMGASGYVGILMTPISMNAISVLTGIVIAALCHILVQIAQRMSSMRYEEAVVAGMRLNIKPILLTALTTLVAFLSLNLSEIPPLRDMGNTVALGIVFSILVALFLFPAILLWLRPRITDFTAGQTRFFKDYGQWLLANTGKVNAVIFITSVSLLFAAQHNTVRDYFAQYYDESFEFRVANDFADQHLTGLLRMEYTFTATAEQGVTDVDYLNSLDQFNQWLEQQPEVRHATNFVTLIKRMNEVWHNNDPAFYRLPPNQEQAAQLLLAYELGLPDPQSLTDLVDLTKTTTRVVISLPSIPSDEMFALEERIESWLQKNGTHFKEYSVTGLSYVLTKVFTDSTVSGLKSTVVAFVFIAVLLVFVFRSLSLGLVSLIPNLLPFGLALGVWALINGDLVLITSAVVTITLGIVVDDTIHFLHKARHFVLEEKQPVEQAIIQTLVEVGPAMVITTVAIGMAFSLLVFSAFLPTVHFGVLSAIILVFALILDLSLMPVLLYLGRRFFFSSAS